jgi:hypothetical protein
VAADDVAHGLRVEVRHRDQRPPHVPVVPEHLGARGDAPGHVLARVLDGDRPDQPLVARALEQVVGERLEQPRA